MSGATLATATIAPNTHRMAAISHRFGRRRGRGQSGIGGAGHAETMLRGASVGVDRQDPPDCQRCGSGEDQRASGVPV